MLVGLHLVLNVIVDPSRVHHRLEADEGPVVVTGSLKCKAHLLEAKHDILPVHVLLGHVSESLPGPHAVLNIPEASIKAS